MPGKFYQYFFNFSTFEVEEKSGMCMNMAVLKEHLKVKKLKIFEITINI